MPPCLRLRPQNVGWAPARADHVCASASLPWVTMPARSCQSLGGVSKHKTLGSFPQSHPRGHLSLFGQVPSGLPNGIEGEIGRWGIVCVHDIVLLFFSTLPQSAPTWTWNFWPHPSSEFSRANRLSFLNLSLLHSIFISHHCSTCCMSPRVCWHLSYTEGLPLLSPSWGAYRF